MNGPHDVGGMQNFGPVPYYRTGPVFHQVWESRIYALNRALAPFRRVTGYIARAQSEQWNSADYYRMSYYERWYQRMVELLVQTGMVSQEEIVNARASADSARETPLLRAEQVVPLYTQGRFAGRNRTGAPARFQAGQRIRTRNMHPTGFTRLPRYARGRFGMVQRDYGVFPLPDAVAHGLPDRPQHVYSVRFEARELWGEQAMPQDKVHLDLWDEYLEPA